LGGRRVWAGGRRELLALLQPPRREQVLAAACEREHIEYPCSCSPTWPPPRSCHGWRRGLGLGGGLGRGRGQGLDMGEPNPVGFGPLALHHRRACVALDVFAARGALAADHAEQTDQSEATIHAPMLP